MRIGAEWISAEQGLMRLFDEDGADLPFWVNVGYVVADVGALLLLIALIVGGVGIWRLRSSKGTGLLKATMVISVVLLAASVVAVWAMSAKPT
jgi:hypothetical protein